MTAVIDLIVIKQSSSTNMNLAKNHFFRSNAFLMPLVVLMIVIGLTTTACNGSWLGADLFNGGWFGRSNADDNAALLSNVTLLNVDMYDTYYGDSDTNMSEPPLWSVPAGSDVVVNLINHGAIDHNWAIVKKGTKVPIPYEEGQAGDIILHGIGMVYNNSQTTITFAAPEAGEYQVICTVSGHYPLMQGRFQVTDSDQIVGE